MVASLDPYHRWLGIAPPEQPPHHYRLLGLSLFESDPEVIRDAAERQIAHVRTYQLGTHAEVCQSVLNELAAAKACLLTAEAKAAYDDELRASLESGGPPPVPPVIAPAPPPVIAQERPWPRPAPLLLLALILFGTATACALLFSRYRVTRTESEAGGEVGQRTRPAERSAQATPRAGVAVQTRVPTIRDASPATTSAYATSGNAPTPPKPLRPPPPPRKQTPIKPEQQPAPNAHEVRRQKELERKAAQQKEQERRKAQRGEAAAKEAALKEAARKEAERKEQEKQGSLRSIQARRTVLLDQMQQCRANLQRTNGDLVVANAEHARLLNEQSAVMQQLAMLDRQAANIRSQPFDPEFAADRQQALNNIALDTMNSQARYDSLEAAARKVNATRTALLAQITSIKADMDRLVGEADQLRAEWLRVTDAYGYLKRGEYESAAAVFGEWIALEPSSAAAHVARGVAYRKLGRQSDAAADFKKASRLDPRNATRMTRELQRALDEAAK